MDEDRIWNEAIDAFAQRLMRYYQNQSGTSSPAVVEYHIKQIANDLKKEKPMTKQNKEDLKLIIDYYGVLSQLTMCIEEMSELTKELCKYHRGKCFYNAVIEEVADVLITIEQVKMIFGFKNVELQRLIDSKIQRTLKRMEQKQ